MKYTREENKIKYKTKTNLMRDGRVGGIETLLCETLKHRWFMEFERDSGLINAHQTAKVQLIQHDVIGAAVVEVIVHICRFINLCICIYIKENMKYKYI